MSTPIVENTINSEILNAMDAASTTTEYSPVKTTALFLEHTVNNITNSNINKLWGPKWSLFLAMIVDDIEPKVSIDVAVLAVTDVLRHMTGYLDIGPEETIAKKTSVSIEDVATSSIFHGSEQQIYIAEQACMALNIPTPSEVSCLYDVLGNMACPSYADQLFKLSPGGCKSISKNDIPGILVKLKEKKMISDIVEIINSQQNELSELQQQNNSMNLKLDKLSSDIEDLHGTIDTIKKYCADILQFLYDS